MPAVAAKKRAGRGVGGARHEAAILVRFTFAQDADVRAAAEHVGAQIAQFIREAAVTRARGILAERDGRQPARPTGPART